MTETPAPDAAVEIALGRVSGYEYGAVARDVVAALARAGWLTPPAEVAALRAVAEAIDTVTNDMACGLEVGGNDDENLRDYHARLRIALGALPSRDAAAGG